LNNMEKESEKETNLSDSGNLVLPMITLCSVNLRQGECRKWKKDLNGFVDQLWAMSPKVGKSKNFQKGASILPDVIAIQEAPPCCSLPEIQDNTDQYTPYAKTTLYSVFGEWCWPLANLCKQKYFSGTGGKPFADKSNIRRYAWIQTFVFESRYDVGGIQHKRKHFVKIANVHLAGGRCDDWYFEPGTRRDFMQALIKKEDPDIIMGDFNGSPLAIQGQLLKKSPCATRNLEHYQPYAADPVRFLAWKAESFEILDKAGYVATSDEFRETSIYGDMVDWIFVKKERFQVTQHWIVEMFGEETLKNPHELELAGLSDHHAVCCRLKIMK